LDIHLHSARTVFGFALGIGTLLPLVGLAIGFPATPASQLVPVTGSVSYHGQPVAGMFICFDSDGDHAACGPIGPDGSFELRNVRWGRGVAPGRYRVHFFAGSEPGSLPSRYKEPATSGLEIVVGPDWNQFTLDLP
jgi:hypothetical protein